ncbi:MAG: UvrD-helicase domain-containing protein [Chloroflexota bacterium]
MDILEGLNPAQREAVEAIKGPVLVLAGPGSGKTRVIAHRIAYLIKTCGVSPHRIIAVTFTNKAAREMTDRLGKLIASALDRLTMGTFHAICARILRREGKVIRIEPDFLIYDDEDQLSVIKRCLAELDLDPKLHSPRAIQNAISAAKNQMLPPEASARQNSSYFGEVVKRVYERYEELLAASKALDFDDLLLKVVELFHKNSEVLARYQLRYQYVLVDEFQDTNLVQYELIKLLGGKYRNIFVVGDPDQSIYSWRFADVRNIMSFEKDFPGARVVLLEQNYRSTKTILDVASAVISANETHKPRRLWTENETGECVSVAETYNEQEEAQFVVSEVERLTKPGGFKPGDIAVMYRTNAQSRVLEEAFIRYGMAYRLAAGVRFYERREIKDLLAYFRLVQNQNDTVSLKRVINTPGRGIGEKSLALLSAWAKSRGVTEYQALGILEGLTADKKDHPFAPQATRALISFYKIMDGLVAASREKNMVELFDLTCEKIGYERYLTAEPDGEERRENVRELRTVAREYENLPLGEGLTAFLEGVALVSDVDGLKEGAEAVTLITLHQAKGLEFPVVFMVGMEDGLLPHLRSFDDPAQMEEERRLCYVGITRAMKKLYLVRAFRRSFMGSSGVGLPSRYLADIPDHLLSNSGDWQEKASPLAHLYQWNRPREAGSSEKRVAPPSLRTGDHVRHPQFGEGVVVSTREANGDAELVVAFSGGGVKKLLQSFARLEKIQHAD